ncbi:MAG: hypothetical protein FJ147_04215 [Deltaproteobacteria bacterium]|nr:hypothetical protein [Deltaproteobacteria bacterium]
MARLYADENFPLPVVEKLRELGHDVLTIHEAGKAGHRTPDETVLAEARAGQRAVLTHNRKHFKYLHAAQAEHAGIITCSEDLDFSGLADRIHKAIEEQPELSNRLIQAYRPQK